MTANLSIDFNQIKSLVTQCDMQEKVELIHLLEKETFEIRFRALLNTLKTDDLSMEEIAAEVESVRRGNHLAGQ